LVDIHLDLYVINWVCSYLSDREQFVIVNRAQSPVLPVVSGVPQGSVLGLLGSKHVRHCLVGFHVI